MRQEEMRINDTNCTRVNKTIAKKAYTNGFTVYVYGDNVNLNCDWVSPITWSTLDENEDFETLENAFRYYNYSFIKNVLVYFISEADYKAIN